MDDPGMELLRRDADREYRERISRAAPRILQTRMEMESSGQAPEAHHGLGETNSRRLWEAVQRKEISLDEATDLEAVHLVVETRTPLGGRRHIVVQTRANAGPQDVETARSRAGILRRATGIRAVPVVITARPSREALEAARGRCDTAATPDPLAETKSPQEEQDDAMVRVIRINPLQATHTGEAPPQSPEEGDRCTSQCG